MKTCKHVFASLALRSFPGRGICPDACVRQAKAYRHEGTGYQEIPEHEASLRAGKGKRAETGTGKGRKCSLDLMLEQTLRYFCEKPLTLPSIHLDTTMSFMKLMQVASMEFAAYLIISALGMSVKITRKLLSIIGR